MKMKGVSRDGGTKKYTNKSSISISISIIYKKNLWQNIEKINFTESNQDNFVTQTCALKY